VADNVQETFFLFFNTVIIFLVLFGDASDTYITELIFVENKNSLLGFLNRN